MENSEHVYPQELVHHDKGHFRMIWGPEEKRKLIAQGWSEERDPDKEYVVHTSSPEHRMAQFPVAAKGLRARIAKAKQVELDKSMDQKSRDEAHFEAEKLEHQLVALLALEKEELRKRIAKPVRVPLAADKKDATVAQA